MIDESYNANPASMAAALALLAHAKGRTLAVLGDMLEMGAGRPRAIMPALAEPIAAAHADLVFASRPADEGAVGCAAAGSRRGAYAETSAELAPQLLAALRPGDTVLVKGSLGSRMAVDHRSAESAGA